MYMCLSGYGYVHVSVVCKGQRGTIWVIIAFHFPLIIVSTIRETLVFKQNTE